MSYELLSEPIRKYIRDKRWDSLRPIQVAAITKILSTNDNYILASRTASGKTEAAFLPILSKLNFNEKGVQVLYISPLIALINDQFYRIEELSKYLDIHVTKWHGEANRSRKKSLVENPSGIVLITPESLEAMFVNSPYDASHLFSNLKYIVVDEIHSFIGTDRGVQLKSILSRLQSFNASMFTVVGLSATLGDYIEAKKMTGDESRSKILLDKGPKEMETRFRFFEHETVELSVDLIKSVYVETKDNKVLIFPNSRGRAEELAVRLKKISDKENGHGNYFSHHSSVDKELREYVEHFAKSNIRNNFCISCTSTLELGIDIGTVDEVVQIDATHSIASLIQRVGRSGRKEGQKSYLFLYATNKWSLLQSLSCWVLFNENYIEPYFTSEKPYDVLLHQILSIVKQCSGCERQNLVSKIQSNFAFKAIESTELEEIIDELLRNDLLELIERELILGIEGEKIVNSREFYSVFKSEPNFKVISAGKGIGEIPFSPQIKIDENILLAAKIWKMIDVDYSSKKINVIPAKDGKKPLFFGKASVIHPRVREKMLEILIESRMFQELDESAANALIELRKDFAYFRIESVTDDRPIVVKENEIIWYTFQGTKVNRSINFLLNIFSQNIIYDEQSSSFRFQGKLADLEGILKKCNTIISNLDFYLKNEIKLNPSLLDFSKWGIYLSTKYQIKIVKEKYFDFDETINFIKNVRFVRLEIE